MKHAYVLLDICILRERVGKTHINQYLLHIKYLVDNGYVTVVVPGVLTRE